MTLIFLKSFGFGLVDQQNACIFFDAHTHTHTPFVIHHNKIEFPSLTNDFISCLKIVHGFILVEQFRLNIPMVLSSSK